jgi:hypothetical protein
MAIYEVPLLKDTAAFRYTIAIDGENFVFAFKWHQRSAAWYMTIMQADGTPIRSGVRLIESWPLNGRDLDPRLFDGVLILLRLDGKTGPPTYDDFQRGNVTLTLITGDDLPSQPVADSPIVRVVIQ